MEIQEKKQNKPTILIVDDNEDICSIMALLVEKEGFTAIMAQTAEDGYQKSVELPLTALFLDIGMAGLSGIELLKKLIKAGHAVPTAFVTGLMNVQNVTLAMQLGAIDMIEKPFQIEHFVGVLHKLVAIGIRQREIYDLLTMVENLLEPSVIQKIKDLQRQIHMIKTFDAEQFKLAAAAQRKAS